MSKVQLDGHCLNGSRSRVEIRNAERFGMYLHHDGRQPVEIAYKIANIKVLNHMVFVGGQHRVGVVEHLFSALYGLKQFNVCLDVYGEEIPFFDGSCMDFVKAVKGLNQDQSSGIRFDDRISVHENGGSILYTPLAADELFVDMSLTHPYIGVQSLMLKIVPASYEAQIAPARTFVFTDENDARLANMPPYGIGITRENVYARTPLRFPDEPVRHKILDLLGDLYVLKRPICGKITGNNTSHHLNLQFVSRLLSILGDDDE